MRGSHKLRSRRLGDVPDICIDITVMQRNQSGRAEEMRVTHCEAASSVGERSRVSGQALWRDLLRISEVDPAKQRVVVSELSGHFCTVLVIVDLRRLVK